MKTGIEEEAEEKGKIQSRRGKAGKERELYQPLTRLRTVWKISLT